MTFSKTLLPNIGGSFENHQNILLFPLVVWILRGVCKHNYVNKCWNTSIYFGHLHYRGKLCEFESKTFPDVLACSEEVWGQKLREIDLDNVHDDNFTRNGAGAVVFCELHVILTVKMVAIGFLTFWCQKIGNSYPKITWNWRRLREAADEIGLLL